jgi:hypothetical protein
VFESSITITRTPDKGFASATSRFLSALYVLEGRFDSQIAIVRAYRPSRQLYHRAKCWRQAIFTTGEDYRVFLLVTMSKRIFINEFNRFEPANFF